MRLASSPFVLFVAAAGPELGFGHLIRAGVLADTLGVERQIVLRGPSAAIDAAIRFGWTVHLGPSVIDALAPDLVVIDDPSRVEIARWMRRARRAHVPVATIHDGDAGAIDSDLSIDGSFVVRPEERRGRIAGPAFAVLDPRVAAMRTTSVVREPGEVLIALGGGAHVRRLGVGIARDLMAALPGIRVDIAAGFVSSASRPSLPSGCRWLDAPHGLAPALSRASTVVVAGGVTLYEACALGCAIVAAPVVAAQRPAVRAAARAGAVIDASARQGSRLAPRVIAAITDLIADPVATRRRQQRARRLVDGLGALRVADRLRTLTGEFTPGGWRHAA